MSVARYKARDGLRQADRVAERVAVALHLRVVAPNTRLTEPWANDHVGAIKLLKTGEEADDMNAPVFTYPLAPAESVQFADLASVRVLHGVTTDEGEEVPAGTEGTVIATYAKGAAYEVEFDQGIATIYAADLVAA